MCMAPFAVLLLTTVSVSLIWKVNQTSIHYANLGDSMSIIQVMNKVKPTEVYNLAAQSHVQVSFDSPEFTADVDATGVLRILEAIRQCGLEKTCRMYQASTSELYGKVEEVPQNENTPFHPYSPYAVAKQYGFWIVKEYCEAYNMFCYSGIPTKAKLNWNPNTTSFEELVKIMVESDMAKVAAEDAGQKVRCNLAEYLEKGIVK